MIEELYQVVFVKIPRIFLIFSMMFLPITIVGNIKEYLDNNNESHEEDQYLELINKILDKGDITESRNGIVKSVFGNKMEFDLSNNTLPLLTTKRVAYKTCIKELLWFIRGQTSNKLLKEQNVHIWDENGSREFLDSRNLNYRNVDDLGPIYGHQWRHFNADYYTSDADYTNKGVDQLMYIINALKDPKEKYSRRLLMSAWNPCQLDEMALPPCHVLAQFNVSDENKLSCALYQRSGDVGLGVPFNIASYSVLTHLIAHYTGLKAHKFVYFLGNAHIYEEHIEPLKEQTQRNPYKFPLIKLTPEVPEKIEDYELNNIEVIDYQCHSKIEMKMKA
uniref:thymidylate synthase n=1 Tax=viral metagenome TaxID=1070528 RepID=A0A6C0AWV9_9ZZZZ